MQDTKFKENRKVFEKIKKLIIEVQRTPYTGTGHPEPLAGDKSGKWSRHSTDKDRLVYAVEDDTISIYSCKGHYEDK